MGLPKRHHVVVYLLAKSKKSSSQLDNDLKLDENEVDAAAWLDEGLVRQISQSDAHGQAIKTPRQYFKYVCFTVTVQPAYDEDMSVCSVDKFFSNLLSPDANVSMFVI